MFLTTLDADNKENLKITYKADTCCNVGAGVGLGYDKGLCLSWVKVGPVFRVQVGVKG